MKQYLPILIISATMFGCSPAEKYAQYGIKGNIKTVIESEYTQVANKFGEWVPADTTEDHQYMIKKYDANGNLYEIECHSILSRDYIHTVFKSIFNNQKLVRTQIFDGQGTLTDSLNYNYSSENTYTETSYDSTGNIDRITLTKIDNHRRPLSYNVTNATDNATLITQEFDYRGDTTFITYADKHTDRMQKLKNVAVKKDDKGNPTIIITITDDSSDTKPTSIIVRKYEYYN